MSAEYKVLLNDVHGDVARASAIFTGMHPDKMVFEVGGSQASASKVALPATKATLQWMTTNSGFVKQYKSVAAYFLPEQSKDASLQRSGVQDADRVGPTPAQDAD